MIEVGFTGTQQGMTTPQRNRLHVYLACQEDAVRRMWFHHGDCIGADHDFHRLVRRHGGKIHLHPPDIDTKRAFCDYDMTEKPFPYLVRNKHITMTTGLLIATPAENHQVLRSGTWSTVRYADKNDAKVWVIGPNGHDLDWKS